MKGVWIVVVISILAVAAGAWWVLQSPKTPPFHAPTAETLEGVGRAADERTADVSRDTIRIGVIAALTGLPAGIQSALPDVARFFTARVNSGGGLLGRTVDLAVLDNANTALGARMAAEEAAKAGVVAVLGGQRSSNAMAMARVLQEAAIPMIAVGASNPDVTRMGDWIFRINSTDAFQGAALARFARENLNGASAALMVNVGNRYSPYVADVFAEQFRQLGGSVPLRREYLPDMENLADAAAALFAADSDVVFLPGYQDDSARILKLARRAGVRSIFIGGDGWDRSIMRAVGDAAEGSYFSAHWHPDADLKGGLAEAVAALTARKKGEIGDVEMLALDAVHLLFAAIQRAGKTDRRDVRDALAATDGFVGACGAYRFDRNGDPEKPLAVLRFQQGTVNYHTTLRPETLRVGVIFAKTGDAAPVNRMGFEAARFAGDEINLKGGIRAHRIELIEYDNESTALGARRAAEAAVREGVCAVIGASWSSHSSAMAPILEAAGIPMLTPASTNPSITRNRPHVFRICYTDGLQGEAMARFALTVINAKTAAVMINANNQYSVDLARFFMEGFRPEGRIVAEVDYLQSTNDFRPHLGEILRVSPDVVFVPGYPRDSAYIIRQARSMGLESLFLGGDGWDDIMYEYAGDAVRGSYFTEHWHVDLPDPRSRDFVARYAAEHKHYRTGLVALTYDTVHLLADAVRRAGSTMPGAIRDALADTRNFMGVTGSVTFNAEGDPRKPVVILRFDDEAAAFDRVMVMEEPAIGKWN